MPSSEQREKNVRKWYADHNDPTIEPLKAFDWSLINLFGGVVGHKVLNVGPGNARDENAHAHSAAEWHALDFVPEVIQRGTAAAPQATWQLGDARSLPYADGYFSRVLALSSVEHIPTVEGRIKAHSEAARVLREGGLYVLVFTNRMRANGLIPEDHDGDYGYEHTHLLGELVNETQPSGLVLLHYLAGDPFQDRVGSVWVKGTWAGL